MYIRQRRVWGCHNKQGLWETACTMDKDKQDRQEDNTDREDRTNINN